MNILEWWPLVDAGTRRRLIEHNGEPVPQRVIADIKGVTGGTSNSEWWTGDSADGPQLSDGAVDGSRLSSTMRSPLPAEPLIARYNLVGAG